MSDAPSDLVSRGRAIFERLRGGEGGRQGGGPDEPAPTEKAAPIEEAAVDEASARDDATPPAGEAPADDQDDQDVTFEATEAPPPPGPSEDDEPPVGDPVAASAPAKVEALPPPPVVDEPPGAEPSSAPEPDGAPTLAGDPTAPTLTVVAEVEPSAATAVDVSEKPAPISRFVRPLPRVIAIANQKGGVGKTTTAVNLGAGLAEHGYRTLVVDLDPQGNASTGLGINVRDLQSSMYDVVLHDTPMDDCIEPTSVRNLFVAPASLDLAGAEIELVPAFSRELRLKRALDDVRDDYDFVLIDCPPSLGLLTVNSMAAATEVLVPIQCEYYALEGLGQLMRNVGLVQKNLNPVLEMSIIVLVMYDARTKLSDQVVQEVRAHFGDKVCRTVVPRTVRLSEAPSFGQPILSFDPRSRGAIAYRELAKEVSGGAT